MTDEDILELFKDKAKGVLVPNWVVLDFGRALLAKAVPDGFVVVPQLREFQQTLVDKNKYDLVVADALAGDRMSLYAVSAAPSPEGEKK